LLFFSLFSLPLDLLFSLSLRFFSYSHVASSYGTESAFFCNTQQANKLA
jgi:hypothetical protein